MVYLLGGSGEDTGVIFIEGDSIYVVGWTNSPDFYVSPNAIQKSLIDNWSWYVAKFKLDGQLVYSTYIGATHTDEPLILDARVDHSGNVYISGWTNSQNFPVTSNAIQKNLKGPGDVFLIKLNSDGGLLFSTYIGGSGDDEEEGMYVDGSGNIYIIGETDSLDFPVTSNAFQKYIIDKFGIFLSKFDSKGNLVYSTYLGGFNLDEDVFYNVDTDSNGNIYVTGCTDSPNLVTTSNAIQKSLKGSVDGFVMKINSQGELIYSTYLGGSQDDIPISLTLDPMGNIYIVGATNSTDFPITPNAIQRSLRGEYDAFIVKLSSTGELLFSTYLGGSGTDGAFQLMLDSYGNIYVVGDTYSFDFPVTPNAVQKFYGGQGDTFLVKIFASNIFASFAERTPQMLARTNGASLVMTVISVYPSLCEKITSTPFPFASTIFLICSPISESVKTLK